MDLGSVVKLRAGDRTDVPVFVDKFGGSLALL
jgi:hypothetical protein